jgi:hypothetical protein
MADKTTTAALLQRQSDNISRAQEKIEHDPEEAKAKVEAAVTTTDGSPITVQDMLGLFMQLQQSQQQMQQQIVQLLGDRKQDRTDRVQAYTQAELDRVAAKQRATIETWRTEPKEPIWIEPDFDERKIAESHGGEMPPRMFMVNGVSFPIKVGEVVEVPTSIAALVRHTQGAFKKRNRPAQALQGIPDPQSSQFLAGAQSISVGRDGKVGDGQLVPSPAAASPDQAGPLDVRYDAFGR